MVAGGKGGPTSSVSNDKPNRTASPKSTASDEPKDEPAPGMNNVAPSATSPAAPHFQQLTVNPILPEQQQLQQQPPQLNELAWKKVPDIQSHEKTPAGAIVTTASTATPQEPPKPQKSPTLCNHGSCKAKINFLSFACRCGGNFCVKHRCAEEHKCTYDYKNMATKEMAKNNPKIVREKINKI